MKQSLSSRLALVCLSTALVPHPSPGAPVISEIMFHPGHAALTREPVEREWFALANLTTVPVDASGWRVTKGVDMVFPTPTTVPASGVLVVAADAAAFIQAHPGYAGPVVGGWTGRLSNGGETLTVVDGAGAAVDEVSYSTEGDWATRARPAAMSGHQGWVWDNPADGGGPSIKKQILELDQNLGRNWKPSAAAGGSPGVAPTVGTETIFATKVEHDPEIPRSTDPITITATLYDVITGALLQGARVRWRLDGAGSFQTLPMTVTRRVNGATVGLIYDEIDVTATLPAQANNTIVEYYLELQGANGQATWPAPARTSLPGVQPGTFTQAANCLIQVDNSHDPAAAWVPGAHPLYRLIMTAAERAELLQIQTNGNQADSDAAMNGTFISRDGTGVKTRPLVAIRNRGTGSRLGPPNNYNVAFRNDDPWEDRSTLQINCRYPHSQVLGAFCFESAGIAPQSSGVVRVRVNGVDLAETNQRMYGRYVRNETMGGGWAERHYPNDPNGNLYFLDDHDPGSPGTPVGNLGSGEFLYEGANPAAYSDTYFKKSNEDLNDYSDLMALTSALTNAPDAAFVATIGQHLDLDQWLTFIATDALIGNQEGGLQTGRADDVGLYRGMIDPRFRLVPHDFDSVFAFGLNAQDPGGVSTAAVGNPVTRSIFSYDGEAPTSGSDEVQGLHRLFIHPEIVPRYYAKLLEQINLWFNHATLDPAIDQLLGGWVAPTGTNVSVASAKAFIDTRTANVLSQIQRNYAITAAGNAADLNGMKQTTDGSATFSGTFNVAETYSIRLNGVPASLFYRTAGADAAGTWKFTATAGSGFLQRGINRVTANFYDGINGTGNLLRTLTVDVYYSGGAQTGIAANGLPQASSLALLAPASYLPGLPFLVRVDLTGATGTLDRAAWNSTVTLSATNGVTLNPSTLTLTNGMGSALVTVGGGGGGATQTLLTYGTGGTGTTGSGTGGSPWKAKSDFTVATLATFIATTGDTWRNEGFNDSTWATVPTQVGYGNSNANTSIADPDYDPGTTALENVPCYLFRTTFPIADVNTLVSVTGQIKYDDAYAIYVNGQDINQRANVAAGSPLSSYASATSADNATAPVTIPLAVLHNGLNTIAVEIRQGNSTSSDVRFDLQLSASLTGGAADPGNFTLSATSGALSTGKAIASLGVAPAMTVVSGTLPVGPNTWSGIIHVTGDVTVPTGAALTIAPGTHVLIDGDATTGSTAGRDLIVTGTGTVNAAGTAALPISITASTASTRWGEINTGGATTTWNYSLISHAGHSPGGGHTGTGPCIRLANGAVFSFNDGVISDLPGKILTNAGNTTMTMRRSHFGRCVMGPETDGSAITIEDCNFTDMLPAYRESGAADDEDCIYIHDSGGRPVNLRRSVFANSGDDGIDCLAGSLTVEDCIIRNIEDKGISLLQNNITVRRSQIIDCDFGVSLKTQIGAEATAYTTTLENCTIVGAVHSTNESDQSGGVYWHNVGIHVRNKYGTGPNAQLFVNAKNCIVSAITPVLNDYAVPGNDHPLTTASYCCYQNVPGTNPVDPLPPAGTGTITADPLFVSGTTKDFRLQSTSPCRNTGDPASPLDADGSRADMGALPFGGGGAGGTPTNIVWSLANSPFRIATDVTIPTGSTLTIEPGVSVLVDENRHVLVNGSVRMLGTENRRITLSGVPGLPLKADPADPGLPLTTPKWGGVWLENSNDPNNLISYVDFVDAQDALSGGNATSRGCIGLKESACTIDHCTFRGTHLHIIYGDHCSITLQYCDIPDVFAAGEAPGALNNVAEPVKLVNKFLPGGRALVRWNTFHGNKGHHDVLDVDSDVVPNPILQLRENLFLGQIGDEHCDLGGDVFIDGNTFARVRKDAPNTSNGYANAFTTGDAGTGTTVVASRNTMWDLDHAVALKGGTGAIFEHNTFYSFHTNTVDATGKANLPSVIAFLVPLEGTSPGDGAYCGENIFWTIPRVFGDADRGTSGVGTFPTRLQFERNLVDPATTTVVGSLHPGGLFSLGTGNFVGDPKLVDPANGDFGLSADSPARGAGFFGNDLGAQVPAGAWITGEPPMQTPSTSATLSVGGPGLFFYKWKLDNGAWSPPIAIDPANPLRFPRNAPTIRIAQIQLTGLAAGPHTVSVVGQDFAGVWQEEAVATVSRTWTVIPALTKLMISEVLADAGSAPDQIELHNAGAASIELGVYALTDDPLVPGKYLIPGGTVLASGGYLAIPSTISGVNLDRDGDAVYLFEGATLIDSVVFGSQVLNLSLGRASQDWSWSLCAPTPGAANQAVLLGDSHNLRISEWLASPSVHFQDDFVELHNQGALPVALDGLRLTDARPGAPARHILAPHSFIAAGGYVKLVADGNPDSGPSHLAFKLDPLQERLALLDSSGALIDEVYSYGQTDDFSQSLGATGQPVFNELATPGFAMAAGDPVYLNALALQRGLRITEIMFNAVGGNDFDWIELRNVGGTPFNLQGVAFVEGIDFTFGNLTLPPGQSLVLVANLTAFHSRYGVAPDVAGTYATRLDNGGETLTLRLPAPFEANVLRFRYEDDWYPETDGGGRSLDLTNVTAAINTYDRMATWQASPILGGTPDGATQSSPTTYVGWKSFYGVPNDATDGDFDGLLPIVEFALGLDPASSAQPNGVSALPVGQLNGADRLEIQLRLPVNPAAVQGHGRPEVLYEIQISDGLNGWTTIATKTPATSWAGSATITPGTVANGFQAVTVEDATGLPTNLRRFLRMKTTWQPQP